jgi:hypothetical protein
MYNLKSSVVFCVLLVTITHTTFCQVRTVIIPEPTKSGTMIIRPGQDGKLQFSLKSIPKTAKIDSAVLRFVLAADIPPASFFTLRILKQNNSGGIKDSVIRDINKISFNKNTPLNAKNDVLKEYVRANLGRRELNVNLRSTSKKATIEVYSADTSANIINYDYSRLPRLIVYYKVPTAPAEWNGFEANAQHNSRTVTEIFGSNPLNQEILTKVIFEGQILTPVSVYKNKLFFMFSYGSKTYIGSLDPVTLKTDRISGDIRAMPNFSPMFDRDGRYYFLNANSISYWDPENNEIKTAVTFGQTIPKTNLTIGRDGSLYFVTGKNVYAYSPYPSFQKLWQYNYEGPNNENVTTDGVSPVTLSNDDSYAYIVTVRNGNKAYKRLTAINTLTGQQENHIILGLENTDVSRTPSPVPTPVVSNNGDIFLTNGYPTGDTLYILGKTLNKVSIHGVNISQPLVNNKGDVFYFDNSNLKQVGSSFSRPLNPNMSIENVGLAGKYFYAINQTGGKNRALILDGDKFISQTPVSDSNYSNLVVAADGSSYITTSTQIIAVRNRFFDASGNLFNTSAAEKQNAVYRADDLTIDGNVMLTNKQILIGAKGVSFGNNVTLEDQADITVESGGVIGFKPGFTVKKGATLSIKTGY